MECVGMHGGELTVEVSANGAVKGLVCRASELGARSTSPMQEELLTSWLSFTAWVKYLHLWSAGRLGRSRRVRPRTGGHGGARGPRKGLGETYGWPVVEVAVDIGPGAGGTWADVSRLARWAEPRQYHPRFPFRWVGWNGDFNHGHPSVCKPSRGCAPHLHLSWSHSPARPRRPARTVWVFAVR